MNAKLRAAVHERAAQCCEYCGRRQVDSPLIPFHVEHIVPRKHGGDDDFENLCLACPDCNLQKGSDLTGIDPQTGAVTRLFDPRTQQWNAHFAWDGVRIVGTTATGRTTARLLDLNSPPRLRLRLAASHR